MDTKDTPVQEEKINENIGNLRNDYSILEQAIHNDRADGRLGSGMRDVPLALEVKLVLEKVTSFHTRIAKILCEEASKYKRLRDKICSKTYNVEKSIDTTHNLLNTISTLSLIETEYLELTGKDYPEDTNLEFLLSDILGKSKATSLTDRALYK